MRHGRIVAEGYYAFRLGHMRFFVSAILSIESQDLGLGGQRKILLSFSGGKLNLRRTDEWGAEASIDGKRGD